MSGDASFVGKVVGAASQGAVGAVVGATLSAVTEPVVNKVLVERKGVMQAMEEHSPDKIKKFFKTTFSTNFIKFPFFEVVNMIMNQMSIPAALRGTVTGLIFTSATLPITNFRFRQSMNLPIGGFSGLYQAYLPTVGRDVVYGIARNTMMAWLMAADKDIMKTAKGRFKAMFLTVIFSCVVSAPGNEVRGYVLQPKDRAKPFMEFFDPVKTVRSTTIGGLIMAISLATGVVCTPYAEALFARLKVLFKADPVGGFILAFLLLDRWQRSRRMDRLEDSIKAKQK